MQKNSPSMTKKLVAEHPNKLRQSGPLLQPSRIHLAMIDESSQKEGGGGTVGGSRRYSQSRAAIPDTNSLGSVESALGGNRTVAGGSSPFKQAVVQAADATGAVAGLKASNSQSTFRQVKHL